jgi:large subunit ribosomal protein L6
MSRVGKSPIPVPKGAEVTISGLNVTVKGPLGTLNHTLNTCIGLSQADGFINVERKDDTVESAALSGTTRALVNNMVIGVTTGFERKLSLVGVGYRAAAKGQQLELTLGYSHNVIFELPSEIKVATTAEKGQNPKIIMECADNELLGMVAAKIRSLRTPEPYKGKGIKFSGEILRRKAGKSAGK